MGISKDTNGMLCLNKKGVNMLTSKLCPKYVYMF